MVGKGFGFGRGFVFQDSKGRDIVVFQLTISWYFLYDSFSMRVRSTIENKGRMATRKKLLLSRLEFMYNYNTMP